MVGSCKPIMPSPEIGQIFHDEILNKTGIELADVGYIGGEITVSIEAPRAVGEGLASG